MDCIDNERLRSFEVLLNGPSKVTLTLHDARIWFKITKSKCSLQFGCLSCRLFYQRLLAVYSQSKKYSKPPVSLEGQVMVTFLVFYFVSRSRYLVTYQLLLATFCRCMNNILWRKCRHTYLCSAVWQLLWREFFYTAGFGTPNFDRMYGNPICKQVRIQCIFYFPEDGGMGTEQNFLFLGGGFPVCCRVFWLITHSFIPTCLTWARFHGKMTIGFYQLGEMGEQDIRGSMQPWFRSFFFFPILVPFWCHSGANYHS